ncbi:uncharacterized protein NPIL_151071 [Nephila pilipes]|uniref:Uncharacterized protein n=1 Tax=Nephila pilipes TaxID=299642 RepID=A0A8X6NGV7_NEPPI|nr:uncharacterized protein NPIL_151071 [Nephila pilipes]
MKQKMLWNWAAEIPSSAPPIINKARAGTVWITGQVGSNSVSGPLCAVGSWLFPSDHWRPLCIMLAGLCLEWE